MGNNNREQEKVTQEQLDRLVEDVSYLQDEAEAMKYVIDEVPFKEAPPEGRSIAEMLLLIDHAQLSYYRPIIEDAIQNPRPTHLKDYEHYLSTFELDEEKTNDIQNVLSKIAKHRAGLVNAISKIPLIDWETSIYGDNRNSILYDFVREMIRFERSMLKEIADLVMVFNQDKQTRREIEQRSVHHSTGNDQNED